MLHEVVVVVLNVDQLQSTKLTFDDNNKNNNNGDDNNSSNVVMINNSSPSS